MDVLLVSTDLMTASQITGAGGAEVATCGPDQLSQRIAKRPPRLIVLDLSAQRADPAAAVAAAGGTPIVAFGPHVHAAKLRAAEDAGCAAVMSRGQFFRDPAAVFQSYLGTDAS